MQIKRITVQIEYRIYAGSGNTPKWKALRARVREDNNGRTTFGSDLFTPNVTNVDEAISLSLRALPHVHTVRFVFAPPLCANQFVREYEEGRLVHHFEV